MKKIGVDLDEVIYPFVREFLKFNKKYYKTRVKKGDIKSYNFSDILNCTDEEKNKRNYEFYEKGGLESGHPLGKSRSVLKKHTKKHTFIAITSRSDIFEESTKRWLDRHYPGVFEELVLCNSHPYDPKKEISKSQVCKDRGVGLMIEDLPRNVLECSDKGISVLMVGDYPWNKIDDLPENVKRVYDWDQIDEHLSSSI